MATPTKIIITMERDVPTGGTSYVRHRVQRMTYLHVLEGYKFPERALEAILVDLKSQFPPESTTQTEHGSQKESEN